MIKVMIVEDEPNIQKSIKRLIESIDPEFSVTSLAFNGEKAISMLQESRPDVVFTDIHMPVVDGIELMSFLSKNHPEIMTIVISGYQEFEYAKKAMQLGAHNYINKPVSAHELEGVLKQVSLIHKNRKADMLRNYASGAMRHESPPESGKHMRMDCDRFFVMLLCAGAFPISITDHLIPAKAFWDHFDFESKAQAILDQGDDIWVFDGKSAAEKIALFTLRNDSDEKLDGYTGKIRALFCGNGMPVTIVVSNPLNSLYEIGPAFQSLRTMLFKRIVIGRSQVISQNEETEDANGASIAVALPKQLENRLLYSLKQNTDAFNCELKELFNHLNEHRYPQTTVERYIKHLITICQIKANAFSKYDNSNLELEINEAIANSLSYDELFLNTKYIFEGIIESKKTEEPNAQIPELILRIKAYIDENFDRPITNTTLAAKFGLVPSYISKLFKAHMGISPSDYITSLRIERAKELIKSRPDCLTKEIAAEVGYSDSHYFSRIFKKTTGIYPTEYKNS